MKKICFIPIDNRPITYSLTKDIVSIDKEIIVELPKREYLGGLTSCADIEQILQTVKNSTNPELMVLSLDTIAYGGLVSSRRGPETFDEIKDRIYKLKEILKSKKQSNPNLKIYATSSIMRISNNNVNEEEKEYWSNFGKEIFKYSYVTHQMGCTPNHSIPDDILDDYLKTRKRNFEINRFYLDLLEEGIFDYIVYSKDDTGEYGLNVKEAELLEAEIKARKLNAIIKTGADEIPLGLMLRGLMQGKTIKIKPKYTYLESINKISRYEDISVEKCVKAQIELGALNAEIVDIEPDITFYINNFKDVQGDLVFQDVINENSFNEPTGAYFIADINNANGADRKFADELLLKPINPDFFGYSAYNTSANSIGSALAIGLISYFAKKKGTFNEKAFKKLMMIRFLDDLAYQADIRKNADFTQFKNYEKRIGEFLNYKADIKYSLPWNRSFEVEINIEENDEN